MNKHMQNISIRKDNSKEKLLEEQAAENDQAGQTDNGKITSTKLLKQR